MQQADTKNTPPSLVSQYGTETEKKDDRHRRQRLSNLNDKDFLFVHEKTQIQRERERECALLLNNNHTLSGNTHFSLSNFESSRDLSLSGLWGNNCDYG